MKYFTIKDPLGSILFFVKSINLANSKERREAVLYWFDNQSPSISISKKEELYLKYEKELNLDIELIDKLFVGLSWQTYIVKPLLEEKKEILDKSGLIELKDNKYVLTELGSYLFDKEIYNEYIKSITFKANFWKRNNVKITDNENIGSGSFIEPNVIITCKHVWDDLKGTQTIQDENGKQYSVNKILRHKDENIDLLKIVTNEKFDFFPYSIETNALITERIIVFGYPPIPLTSKPFLLANLGEISSLVDNYLDKTDCLILSCITRPGNSGPIINENGKLVGIVIQNRQHKFAPTWQDMDNLDVNKALGYSTGIRSKYILEF